MSEIHEVDRRTGARAAAELAQLVRETVAAGVARQVLHLRIGSLAPEFRRPHHQRLLRDALEPLMAAGRTRIFDLPNGDVVAVAPPPALALETARRALARALDVAADEVVLALRLPEEAAQLLAATSDSLGLEPPAPPAPAAPTMPAGTRLTSLQLHQAELAMAQADLAPFIRAQGVCALDPEGGPARLLWQDRRIAWPALAAALLPGVSLAEGQPLARRLARTAEARMLAELVRPRVLSEWRPVGLRLAPATLLSPAFGRFEAALPAGRRETVTINLDATALLGDPAGFLAARDLARSKGFRLALEVGSVGLLGLMPALAAEMDVLRLPWSPALPAAPPQALSLILGGAQRLLLTEVDRPAAIAWGWEAGIGMFQGPLVEKRR